MPPSQLILIAHAETIATRRAAFARDEDLEPRGAAAAFAARRSLPPTESMSTSPALAARRTAEALGIEGPIEPRLRDLDVGAWAGGRLSDLAERDPGSLHAWTTDPHFAGHGGESLSDLRARVGDWLEARLAGRGTAIAVSHAAILRVALVAALDAPLAGFWRIDAPPLSALTLGSDGRRWALRGFGALPPLRANGG